MNVKTCFKCGETKKLDEFYKHPQMADGRVNKCKECNKNDVRKNRAEKIDYYRQYDKNRSHLPERILSRGGSLDSNLMCHVPKDHPSYGEHSARTSKINKVREPKKHRARSMVSYAVRVGNMSRPKYCEGCGEKCTPHGHHEDYEKPLDVIWLCASCHSFVHYLCKSTN